MIYKSTVLVNQRTFNTPNTDEFPAVCPLALPVWPVTPLPLPPADHTQLHPLPAAAKPIRRKMSPTEEVEGRVMVKPGEQRVTKTEECVR